MKNKHIIPLRKECMKVPVHAKTRKAVKAVKAFVQKHAKAEDVRIGKYLNQKLWERGNRNPPHKVEVMIETIEEEKDKQKVSYVKVELFGAPKEEKKKKEKKSLLSRLKGEKAEEKKPEAAKKEDKAAADLHEDSKKKEEVKKEEKALEKESKELQKEKLPKPEKPKAKPESQKEMQKPREERVISETGK